MLLANWLHLDGEDGDARVCSWSGRDVDGWVVQRELAAPEDYVTAWLRDSDEGERFDALYDGWMDCFAERRVEAVAFGVLALRRRGDRAGRVWLDDAPQSLAPAWGEQLAALFAAQDALDRGLLATAWRLRDDVRLHTAGEASGPGWAPLAQVLRQERGLRWSSSRVSLRQCKEYRGPVAEATMTSKGQLTVPVEVRRRLGLRPGSRVEFLPTASGSYELVARTGSVRNLKGMLPPPTRAVTLEEMDDAVAQGAAESARR